MESNLYEFSVYKAPIKNIIPARSFSLENIYKIIISEKYKKVTTDLRNAGDSALKSRIKATELDYVTFSGLFSNRSSKGLIKHSNLFCLDLDDLQGLESIKSKIIMVLPPALMFTSPSGNGLKLVYKIEITKDASHLKYYNAFELFFKSQLNLIIDEKCKDVPRACFLCHDNKAYYDHEAEVLDISFIDTFTGEVLEEASQFIESNNEIIKNLKIWLDKSQSFVPGNRNNYITRLAAAFNRYGLPRAEAESELLNYIQSDFKASEIKATVKSIYNNTSYHNIASFKIEQPHNFEASSFKEKKEESTPLIPIDGFPNYLQGFINEYTEVYKTPRDYITASVIFSTAFAIGNKLELRDKYDNIPLLWLAIVGNVSSGKTDPLSTCLSFFNGEDKKSFDEYTTKLKAYKLYEELNKKEKENAEQVDQPFYFQYLLSDYTPEALYNVHTINNRGICIYRDELKGWLDDFGRYSKSGEQSTMLSTFYRQPMPINRASKEPININKPCIYVAGGIQPEVLKDLAKDSRAENGFLSRLMFAYPDLDIKQPYSNKKLNNETIKEYHNYLKVFTGIKENIDLYLSPEAELIYTEWYNKNADLTNNEPKGYLKGVYGKLDVISLRLAIVVQGMDLVCNGNTSPEITKKSMQTAVNLIEYFRVTAMKVYDKIFIDNIPKISKKDVAKYCKSLGASQSQIATAIKTSQQYVGKILKE